MDERLTARAKTGQKGDFQPARGGLREVAGRDLLPDLLLLRLAQRVPPPAGDPLRALQIGGAVLTVGASRLIQKEDAAPAERGPGGL